MVSFSFQRFHVNIICVIQQLYGETNLGHCDPVIKELK